MKFQFDGDPIAKMRPRLGKYGVFDPQSTRKVNTRWEAGMQMRAEGHLKLQDGPIEANMTFHMPIPRSLSQKAANALEGDWCDKNKDTDNMAKFYMDVLNGIAYHDDRQIARLVCEKIYAFDPFVEIELNSLPSRRS